MDGESRNAIFNDIPETYELQDGRKFKINKSVGKRETPTITMPYLVLVWGQPSGDQEFVSNLLGFVPTVEEIESDQTVTSHANLENDGDSYEWEVTPTVGFINQISFKFVEAGIGVRARLKVYFSQNGEWELQKDTYIFNFQIDKDGWSDFPLALPVVKGRVVRFEIASWDFDRKGGNLKIALHNGIPVNKMEVKARKFPKYGRLDIIELEIKIGLGDIGIMGGSNYIENGTQVRAIYETLMARIKAYWTKLVDGGHVSQIGRLVRLDATARDRREEGQWQFTVQFRYEAGRVIKDQRYSIDSINLKRVYLKNQ